MSTDVIQDVSAARASSRWQSLLRVPSSFAFRLALFYGVIFTASAAVLISVIAFASIASLTKERDLAISAELSELDLERRSGKGIDEIKREIIVRDNAPDKSEFVYALFDPAGNLLAGTRLKVPRGDGWSDVTTRDPDKSVHTIHFKSLVMPLGYLVAVGEDTGQVEDMRAFLFSTFAAGLIGAVLLALVGAVFLRSAFSARLDRIASVCRNIMAGDLSLRVPTTSGDEIDVMAKSLNAMLDRIVVLMGTLQQVTVDIAHDMRTPLARVRQGLETAELKGKTADDYSIAVRKAVGEIDTVLETFAALLRIAELQAGALRSTFKPVDLSEAFQTVADAYTPSAEENGQHIETQIEPGVIITGDENLLTQMIANLVANALLHTPSGTTVRVTLEKSASRLRGVVSDNGSGIPEADRKRVFERFVRLERSRSTPGSGLGLSVSAAIAELHGAHIELRDNHPGLRCELTFS